jgi:hypothetical protein
MGYGAITKFPACRQASTNNQSPNDQISEHSLADRSFDHLEIGKFGICLEFGICDLEFEITRTP